MTQKEIEDAIEELDKRVERLRAMYDQYFLGIERLEPSIQRKDVERRFFGLRREKIRNTAVRFRFTMLCQRFTTYQTFWQRVARQIEEGTYRRDVMKVRQRLQLQRAEKRKQRMRKMGYEVPDDEGIDVEVEVDVDVDGGAGVGPDADEAWAAQALAEFDSTPSARAAAPVRVHELASEVREFTKALEEAEEPAGPGVLTFGKIPRAPVEHDDEDEETNPGTVPPKPRTSLGRVALRKMALSGGPIVREEKVLGTPRDAAEERLTPPVPAPRAARSGKGVPGPLPPAEDAALPPQMRGARGAPSPPPDSGETDLRSLFLRRGRTPPGGKGGEKASASGARGRAAGGGEDGLPDDRVRAIYDQYRAARRQNNEGDVAFESVKKSIREMLPKLRDKAPGRKLDFEVVIKDGKTVLKPVAK